jgi:hypothetical protein
MKLTGIIAEKLATLIETQGGTIADQITKKVCGLLSDEIPGVVHRLTDTVSKEVGKNIQDKKFSEQMAKNLRETLVAEQKGWLTGFGRGLRKIRRSISSTSTFNVKYGILKPTIHELLEENLRILSVPAAEIKELIATLTAIEGGANTTGKLLDQELYETAAAIIAKSLVGKIITPEIFNVAVNAAYEKHRNASKSSNEVVKPVAEGGNAKRQTARYTKRGRNATYHHSAHGKMYNRTRKYPRKQKSRRKQNNRKSV